MIREIEGTFEGLNGLKLFTKTWQPQDRLPEAVVVLVHGVGEHIDRYPHLVEALVPAGYILAGYDQRGQGRSQGKRSFILSWDEYICDLGTFLDLTCQRHPGLPVFLYGHSMGSLIVLDYLIENSAGVSGAIISGLALKPGDPAPPLLVMVAKALSGIAPGFTLKMELDGSSLSRDSRVARAYMDDPLVHWGRSVRWGTESLKAIERIKQNASKIILPVLLLHGELDRAALVDGSRHFYQQAGSADKTLHIYPGGLHEPHNDIQHQEVMNDILTWLEAHTRP
jgi:alpha-beta hydrolase superfamily lysophospholipase